MDVGVFGEDTSEIRSIRSSINDSSESRWWT